MPLQRIIVIGASAGGVEALTQIAGGFPSDIDAALFVTIHFPPTSASALPRILSRAGPLPAVHARDGQQIEAGKIYIAPPDHHLLIFRDRMRLHRGPRENGNRPAIDPMFRSAALAYGSRVVGIILSGSLDDGTSGLLAIKRRGGMTVVQDPEEAIFPSMPESAIQHVAVDHVVKLDRLAALLGELTTQPPTEEQNVAFDDAEKDVEYSEIDLGRIENPTDHPGVLAPFGCPDCGGTLWELREGELVRFRCRVGHAWTSDALLARQTETLDAALWTALRALEESASLNEQLADRARRRGNERLVEKLTDNAKIASGRAKIIRDVLVQAKDPAPATQSGRAMRTPR
ncbi:MAG TPA: chemotaxis protein CheB [Gemmatimonadaceae bacterium]|nr:chemotaxis protein CheB [Gemmatimonadaceae bacterium]